MNWRTAWRRLQRWTASGVWDRIVAALRAMAPEAGWEAHMLDSTVVRAHAHAAGARKVAGRQALGRSRGASRPSSTCAATAAAGRSRSTSPAGSATT
jgi:transposase